MTIKLLFTAIEFREINASYSLAIAMTTLDGKFMLLCLINAIKYNAE